jgi:hypothetical protein
MATGYSAKQKPVKPITERTAYTSGAFRDARAGKIDLEGHLSPLALVAYAEYLHENRPQPDGSLRAADNWQLGMSKADYVGSFIRHAFDLWKVHRGWPVAPEKGREWTLKRLTCACIFNLMGLLHEICKDEIKGA